MRKIRMHIVAYLLCVVYMGLLCGCGPAGTGQSGESSSSFEADMPELPDYNEPEEVNKESSPTVSCELVCVGDNIVFVDKRDSYIKSLDTRSGEITVLFEKKVDGEFILEGDEIWFSDYDTGTIVCGNIKDKSATEYSHMTMSRGVKCGDILYFVDDGNWGKDVIVYKYYLSSGRWENRRLIGCVCSPNRATVQFADECIWFVSEKNGTSYISALDYAAFDYETVFGADANIYISDIELSGGDLYFADSSRCVYTIKSGSNEVAKYLEGATKIHAKSGDGVFYQRSYGYPIKLYLGNDRGSLMDVKGGVVLSAYGSRAVLQRFTDGKEQIAMVKYPEDSVVYSLECSLYDSVTNGRYTIVFLNDSNKLYLFDSFTGEVDVLDSSLFIHWGVSVDKYYAEADRVLSPSYPALFNSSSSDVAGLFMEAIRRNDRYTLKRLLRKGDNLTPFEGFVFKTCELELIESSDTFAEFSVNFTYYSEYDYQALVYMPECVRRGTITVVLEEGAWKVDANAS